VADPQNTVRVLARHFKADPVVADAQTQVADFLERLDLPFAALGEIRKGLKGCGEPVRGSRAGVALSPHQSI